MTPEIKRELSRDLLANLERIDSEQSNPISLNEAFEQIKSNWLGIAEVSLETTSQVSDYLAQDPLCLTSVVDLMTELVFNAVKHADAKHIFVAVRKLAEREVEVEVTNDGLPYVRASKSGLGTQLLDETSFEWSRRNEGGVLITRAALPYLGDLELQRRLAAFAERKHWAERTVSKG